MFILNEKRINIYAPFTSDSGVTYANLTDPTVRNAVGVSEIPDPVPPADYTEDTYYRTEQDDAPYVTYARKSDEQLAQVMLSRAKTVRAEEVFRLTVTTQAGNTFDADRESQIMMGTYLPALEEGETLPWVLANNTLVLVTKAELKEALRLAGAAMAPLWIKPYNP